MTSSGITHRIYVSLVSLFLLMFSATSVTRAQQPLSSFERERGRMMLKIIKDDLKEHYYDPEFHGLNVEESFKAADEKIKQATANSQIFTIIAQTLMQLNDSHTFFLPPGRGFKIEYGWQMQAVGNSCYVSVVKPGSDAESKGLKAGDLVQTIDGFSPTRQNSWILNYLFRTLNRSANSRHIFSG